jgi:cell division septation protein DedD
MVRNNFVHLSKFSGHMKKIQAFLFICFTFWLSCTLRAQEVEITMDHPDQVNAGEVFEVTVTINKGSLKDYSRFSQDLPLGLTATNVSSPNADFSFDNQRIRIIWLKLPDEPEVKVTYNIMVNERLKGTFILGGVFAYVIQEERKFLNFERSRPITIIPNPNVDPSLVVDIKDFKGAAAGIVVSAEKQEEKIFAMAIRQKPVLLGTGAYLVKLLVQNPTGSKYAKIEESIPSGYLFESVDPHEGIESFSSSTVKFIWMKLPEESEFEVSYRLIPKRDEPQGDMMIDGLLTYSEGNENKLVKIKEVDVAFESLSLADKRRLLATGEIPAGAKTSSALAMNRTEPEPREPVKEVKQTSPASTNPPSGSGGSPAASTSAAGPSGRLIVNTRVLGTGSGVYYRVQLAANRTAFDARAHFRGAGVDKEVLVEQHEGYYKYTVGSFTSYSEANDYRKRLARSPSMKEAFVVAYRDGKRVSMSSVR